MKTYDITVRYCGSVGFLGILIVDGTEVYRTGKHYLVASNAFTKVLEESHKFK